MKCRAVITILALALSYAAVAAEQKSEQSPGSQQQSYIPSLAVVMQLIQLSHFNPHSPDETLILATRAAIQI
jgi:hypothetical protein